MDVVTQPLDTTDRRIMGRIRAGLALLLLIILFEPADRLSYPMTKWRIYANPSETPEWIESPAIVVGRSASSTDTVFAAQLFTPVEFRLSEVLMDVAFSMETTLEDRIAARTVIARRLGLAAGATVEGLQLRWRLDLDGRDRLMYRTRPTEVTSLGVFTVDAEAAP